MIDVPWPEPQFRLKTEEGRRLIFDAWRRSWVALTPEEWVRQNFVAYLDQVLKYPSALIALEKEIRVNDLKKRFDVLVYDGAHKPWMLVECKAPEVHLSPLVLDQALRYNLSVPVTYIVISNGRQTMAWHKSAGTLNVLDQLPAWGVPGGSTL